MPLLSPIPPHPSLRILPRVKRVKCEADVRDIVRSVYGPDAVWTEAARGGTAGAPDASLINDGGAIVLAELKAWKRAKEGDILAELRPGQVRFHALAAERGWPAVLIYGIVGEPGLYVIPPGDVPRATRSRLSPLYGNFVFDSDPLLFRTSILRTAQRAR